MNEKSFLKFKEKYSSVFNNRFEYKPEWMNSNPITMFDTVHQIIVTQDISSHRKGRIPSESLKLDFKQNFYDKNLEAIQSYPRDITFLDVLSVNSKTYIKYIDTLTQEVCIQRLELFKQKRIPYKVVTNPKTFEESLPNNIRDKYDYLSCEGKYVIFKIKGTDIICKQRKDGHKLGQEVRELYVLTRNETFESEARLVHGDKYNYSETIYYKASQKVKIICPIHGIFEQTPNDHLSGKGCKQCWIESSVSRQELELLNYVKNLTDNIVLSSQRCDWLDGLELDIYIPELNLAIEYNGFVYHHSTLGVGLFYDNTYVDEKYHLNKFEKCKENGINLIHIFDFEDLEEWKNLIKNIILFPDKYNIQFENCKREVQHRGQIFTIFGQTIINSVIDIRKV